jgi:hypothetical protein
MGTNQLLTATQFKLQSTPQQQQQQQQQIK